jgi:hypothetical protein
MLLMIAAHGVHRFISPVAQHATSMRSAAVAAQVVLALGAAAWIGYRARQHEARNQLTPI